MIIDITVTLLTATATATAVNDIAVTVVLNDEVVNPEETLCERVDACLDIPTDNGQYVLNITDNVISWEEFSATGLVDGNGTTANGSKCDLGGDVIQDTILQFNPREYSLLIGDTVNSSVLYFGDVQNDGVFLFGANDYDYASFNGGGFEVTSSDTIALSATTDINLTATNDINLTATDDISLTATNDISVIGGGIGNILVEGGLYHTQITLEPNETEKALVAKLYKDTDYEVGFAAVDNGIKKYSNVYYGELDANNIITDTSLWEANSSEVHGRKYITAGGNYNGIHCNTTYAQLEYNKVAEDDQTTGTLLTLNTNGVNHYQSGTILNQLDNSGFIYIGSESIDGSWRFATSSGNLVIQKRESGSWVTKQTLI